MSNNEQVKILVVDDDAEVRESLKANLDSFGYITEIGTNGREAILKIESLKPDLIILDVLMPEKDGLQTCREVREKGLAIPIILLTNRSAPIDKVLGLDLGADDYVAKPFEMTELLARIRALLRRSVESFNVEKVTFSDIAVDFRAYKAAKSGTSIPLSAREFRLLQYLVKKEGIVVGRNELLDRVWGYNSYPTTRTVDNHIARLRQKIEDNVECPKHILTVHGVGYKFVA